MNFPLIACFLLFIIIYKNAQTRLPQPTLSLVIKENESRADLFHSIINEKGSAFVADYLEHKAAVRYLCLIATLETALVNYDSLFDVAGVRVAKQL
jgi:hypothetical protein